MPSIAILTFCVGADYTRAMEPALESKRMYAKRHGYTFLSGGDDVWDRSRPIPWSKFRFILKYIDDYDYLFWSDADAVITNPEILLETQVLPLLPDGKDMLWTLDVCGHYNNGHLLLRGRSAWVKDFLTRAYGQTDLLYHIWWDNAAMIRLFETNPSDAHKIETVRESWRFNAYAFGKNNSANDASCRLYTPGDFILHFAGVYEPWNIYRMTKYVLQGTPMDAALLDRWRANPPRTKEIADASLSVTSTGTSAPPPSMRM